MQDQPLPEPDYPGAWAWSAGALRSVRPLAGITLVFSVLVLFGYRFGYEPIYRPIESGPAAHPLTAVCLACGGIVFLLRQSRHEHTAKWLGSAIMLFLAGVQLGDNLFATDFAISFTPFEQLVANERYAGKNNYMGTNTAVMLVCIACASMLKLTRLPLLSQLVAFAGIGVAAVSLVGYAYGLDQFIGQMSLTTTSLGIALGLAALFSTADKGLLKGVFSPRMGGKLARLQALFGFLVPLVLGYVLLRAMEMPVNDSPLGMLVVVACWLFMVMVSVSAMFNDRVAEAYEKTVNQLTTTAMTDQLTGLANRYVFFEMGAREFARAERTGIAPWVLIIDIDHFKRVNDTAGHVFGDQVLVAVAKQIKDAARTVDLVSRIGGEEFAIVLSDTSREGAERVGTSILNAMRSLRIEHWTDVYGPVTVSIGCASAGPGDTLENVVKFADHALYIAKRGGRDQMVFSDDYHSGGLRDQASKDGIDS